MSDRNLYQRLCDIAGDVGPIRRTGKTAQGQPTASIVDVEGALGDLFAKHNVVTGFRWNEPPTVAMEYDKGGRLWQGDVTVWLLNPDAPTELLELRVIEHGSNPSAIVSFALKRVYRSLFHLASETDEGTPVAPRGTPHRERVSQNGAGPKSTPAPSRPAGSQGPTLPPLHEEVAPATPAPAPAGEIVAYAETKLTPPIASHVELKQELSRRKYSEAKALFTAVRILNRPITELSALSPVERAKLVAEIDGLVMSAAREQSR